MTWRKNRRHKSRLSLLKFALIKVADSVAISIPHYSSYSTLLMLGVLDMITNNVSSILISVDEGFIGFK